MMKNLRNIFNTDKEEFDKILSKDLCITLSLDGTIMYLCYDPKDRSITYCKRSGKGLSEPGPHIGKIDKIFIPQYGKCIDKIEQSKDTICDVMCDCPLLTFEICDDMMNLIYGTNKDGDALSYDDLCDISKKIDCPCVPKIYQGKLSDDHKDMICKLCHNDMGDYKEYIKSIFVDKDSDLYKDPIWDGDNIEGLVFDSKYKLFDPNREKKHNTDIMKAKEGYHKYHEDTDKVIQIMVNWMESNAEKVGSTYYEVLNHNFLEMIEDPKTYNKLITLCSNLENFEFNTELLDDKIQSKMTKGGMPLKVLYSLYMFVFKNMKENTYILNKDFQDRINKIIEGLKR